MRVRDGATRSPAGMVFAAHPLPAKALGEYELQHASSIDVVSTVTGHFVLWFAIRSGPQCPRARCFNRPNQLRLCDHPFGVVVDHQLNLGVTSQVPVVAIDLQRYDAAGGDIVG